MSHRAALLLIFILSPAPGLAAAVYFDTSAAFLGQSGNVVFDSFESLSLDNEPVDQITLPGYVLNSNVTPTIPGQTGYGLYLFTFSSAFGAFATDGDAYLVHQSDTDGILSIDFASPVTAFGLSITDWESPTGVSAALTFSNELGDQTTVATGPLPNGNELFFGIVSDTPFSHVEFLNTSPREAYGLDGFYFSAAVPLPGSLLLMLGALTTLAAARKKRSVVAFPRTKGV